MANSHLGALTTHVLDVSAGKPAAGIKIELFKLTPGKGDIDPAREKIATAVTNNDGRCDAPLMSDADFSTGQYELLFHAGDYFDQNGVDLPSPKFVDIAVIRFGVADSAAHYHVPLLLSPFGYTTYRGS